MSTDGNTIKVLRKTWGPFYCNFTTFSGLERNHRDMMVINTVMSFPQDWTDPNQPGQSTHFAIQGILIPIHTIPLSGSILLMDL